MGNFIGSAGDFLKNCGVKEIGSSIRLLLESPIVLPLGYYPPTFIAKIFPGVSFIIQAIVVCRTSN